MPISRQGEQLVERHEGLAKIGAGGLAFPYICPAGKPTIGYGHVIRASEKAYYAKGISKLEAQALLHADLERACASVARLVSVPLSQGQFDALVSFVFNLGGGRLQSSTLRQRLNRGDYEGAADEFKRWVYGGGRKLPGLIARRADEEAMFRAGIESADKRVYVVLPWLSQ